MSHANSDVRYVRNAASDKVVFLRDIVTNELTVYPKSGERHRYIMIGTDKRFSVLREAVMHVDGVGRGVY